MIEFRAFDEDGRLAVRLACANIPLLSSVNQLPHR
jgi:hypothetical protein